MVKSRTAVPSRHTRRSTKAPFERKDATLRLPNTAAPLAMSAPAAANAMPMVDMYIKPGQMMVQEQVVDAPAVEVPIIQQQVATLQPFLAALHQKAQHGSIAALAVEAEASKSAKAIEAAALRMGIGRVEKALKEREGAKLLASSTSSEEAPLEAPAAPPLDAASLSREDVQRLKSMLSSSQHKMKRPVASPIKKMKRA